jgi:hypothetical protein
MCTVSFLPHARGFYLGMNRDESLQRPAAAAPELFLRNGRAAIYPTEPGGGSWVGVNETGLTLSLINWYAIPRQPGVGRVSRGIIVPALLAVGTFLEVQRALDILPKQDLAPFRLLAFAPQDRLISEFRWDQQALEMQAHPWRPRHWFSSGLDEPRAQHERGRTAAHAWREPRAGSLPWLRRLHGSHRPARGPFSFCMHRKDAATVSYTEIVVTQRTATLRYHVGPLCCAPRAARAVQISRQMACKESGLEPTNPVTTHHHENSRSSLQPPHRPLLPGRLSPRGEICAITR